MNTDKKPKYTVLILGAGELGIQVLRAMSNKTQEHTDVKISVLLRSEAVHAVSGSRKARLDELTKLGITVVEGDLQEENIDELSELFAAFDAVINCSGFVGGPGTQIKITQAVLKVAVARYFPWQFGVDYDVVGKGSGQQVWDEQLDVRQLLRQQSATDWVIVSTGIFTSYLFEPGFGVIDAQSKTVCALGDWQYAVTLTTPEDIGQLTADIFFHQPTFKNEIVYIAGDTLTYSELADLMSDHWGTEVNRKLLDGQKLQDDVQHNSQDVGANYRLAFARPDGVAWSKRNTYNHRQGISTTTAIQWLAKQNHI
ncbi:MAG TPA: aromatic alcohol reductase [Pantoea sp.]|uniref:aromatic alcohol reductase n=1 Tax=Pantoea TaxID=53335 RepID=UPI000BB54138|nr:MULTISPECIES: aromatic alcohol reductase [Pantoea]PNK70327.1 aromatic alcohol reductase [Pantoea sp. FDAARGOS_194]HAK33585.1 aromatic alcohol reductase [Pantoea sp.]